MDVSIEKIFAPNKTAREYPSHLLTNRCGEHQIPNFA
jgi:hypothetical protein